MVAGRFINAIRHAHVLSVTQTAMDDNSGFTFLLLMEAAWKSFLSYSS